MGNQDIERLLEALHAVGACRNQLAENAFFSQFMAACDLHHGTDHPIGRIRRADAGIKIPAGEYPRHLAYIVLDVGLLRRAADEFGRAVVVQFDQADGEQLHGLARVVFVGHAAGGRIGFAVAPVRQETTHRSAGRHLLEQVAVVAERIGFQDVDEGRRGKRLERRRDTGDRHDDDLRQRQRHPLAKHVGAGKQLAPQHVVATALPVPVGGVVIGFAAQPVDMAAAAGQRELFGQPA